MSVTLQERPNRELIDRAEPERRALARRLARLRSTIRWHLLTRGLLRVVVLGLALAAASLLCDWLLRMETSSRIALAVVGAVGMAAAVWRWIVVPLSLGLDDLDLAELVERRRRGLGQRIIDVLQLPDLLGTPEFASPTLVWAAVRDHARELAGVDLESLVDARRNTRGTAALCYLLAVPVVFAFLWPHAADIWARRWLLGSNVRWPQTTYLALDGLADRDRLLTPRGEGLVLQLNSQPTFAPVEGGWKLSGRGEPLVVETAEPPQPTIPEKVSLAYWSAGSRTKQVIFTRFEGANFRYELPPLVEPIEVMINGGDDWFGPVRIEPIDRPAVADLKLVARLPGATADEIHAVGNADEPLVFLPETRLELRLSASEPLASAEMMTKDEPPQALARSEASGEGKEFQIAWNMKESQTLELRLVSAASGLASKPYFLTVGLLYDREPRLTLRSAGVGKRVTPQARIPLAIHAADDFGLADLALEIEKTDLAGEKPVTTTKRSELEKFGADDAALPPAVDREIEMKVAEQELVAGNAMRLRASSADRCALGSHTGSSRWLAFQIVTPDELFYEILMRQREQRAKFAAIVVQAQAQSEALAKLEALDGVRPLIRAHQAIARGVSQVASRLEVSLREMTLNELSNPTARQLLADNVIGPLRELHTGPLQTLGGRLERMAAAEAIDGAERDAALQSQQEIVQSMQRILERMSQWESFIDVVNQLRHIIERQTVLKQGTEEAQKKQTDSLFDE
jgi:hypothetical protein